MGQVIDFPSARPVAAAQAAPCMRCGRCGAEFWSITGTGEVRCADCDEPCPFRLQLKTET